ncbi:hypothetical protein KQI63_05920 [bacterium]|nr:hypothetical protein [bacterium]
MAIKPIPTDLLLALAARDYSLAGKICTQLSQRQMNHTAIKYTAALPKIEAEFRKAAGREPWRNVERSDIEIYRRRIANLAEFLTVKHLIDDIRAVGQKAQSLKYFIVPGNDRLSRWETHKLNAYEARLAEESARLARELEDVQLPGMEAPVQKADEVEPWVEEAARNYTRIINSNEPDRIEECNRIKRKMAGLGYHLAPLTGTPAAEFVFTKEPSNAR